MCTCRHPSPSGNRSVFVEPAPSSNLGESPSLGLPPFPSPLALDEPPSSVRRESPLQIIRRSSSVLFRLDSVSSELDREATPQKEVLSVLYNKIRLAQWLGSFRRRGTSRVRIPRARNKAPPFSPFNHASTVTPLVIHPRVPVSLHPRHIGASVALGPHVSRTGWLSPGENAQI